MNIAHHEAIRTREGIQDGEKQDTGSVVMMHIKGTISVSLPSIERH